MKYILPFLLVKQRYDNRTATAGLRRTTPAYAGLKSDYTELITREIM